MTEAQGGRGAHRPPGDHDVEPAVVEPVVVEPAVVEPVVVGPVVDEWSTRPLRGALPPALIRSRAASPVTHLAPSTRPPEPADDDPTGEFPLHDEPIDDEPMPGEPMPGDPMHGEPMHGEPMHGEPTHEHPVGAARRPPKPARQPGDLWRTVARGVGQTLVTAGLVVLLFVVYEVYVTDLFADRRQAAVSDTLREQWNDPPIATPPGTPLAEVPLGDGFAFIRIPRLGQDYVRAIVEGTGTDELAEGPGHYVGTALPGEVGNFAVAGHRVGTGSPFLDLDQMRPGDAIVIETVDSWYTYRVLGDPATGAFDTDPSGIPGQQIVQPSQVEVISPTPGDDAAGAPTGAYLTLTTCNPKYSARQRLIIHAVLDGGPVLKADAPDGPPALTGD